MTLLGLGLAAYGALVVVVWAGQERLLFLPQTRSEAAAEALARAYPWAERVRYAAADGTALHAWWVPPAPGRSVILYFGGNAEDVAWMLERAAGPGAAVPGTGWLLVDYRAYGNSAGSPGEAALVADAAAAYDLVRSLIAVEAPVFAFGRSLGSGVAVQLAARRPLAGLVLMTPFDSAVAVGQRFYPILPVGTLLRHRFDSLAFAPEIDAPALFLIAERDAVIPPAYARRLYDAWAGTKRWELLPGVGHNDTERVDYWPVVRDFVRDSTPAARRDAGQSEESPQRVEPGAAGKRAAVAR